MDVFTLKLTSEKWIDLLIDNYEIFKIIKYYLT